MGLRNSPVCHGVEAVGSVELLHVHHVASYIDRSRVGLLLDQLLEHLCLLYAVSDTLFTGVLSILARTDVTLFSESSSLSLLELFFLDLS